MGMKKKIVQNVVLDATFSREDTGRIIEEPAEFAKKIKIRTQNSGDTDILISQIKDIEGNKVNIFNIKPDNYIYICKNEHNTIIKAILMKDVSTKPILKNQEESKKPQKELPKALKTAEIVSTKPQLKTKAKLPNRVVEESSYQPKERHQAKQETVESRSQAKLKYVGQVCDLLENVGQVCDLLEKGVQVVYSKGDELPHKFNICYSFFTQHPNIGDIVEFTIRNKEVVEVYIPRQDYIQPNSPREYSPETLESNYKLLEDINHGNPNIYRQNISSASELHARKSQLLQSDSERSTDYKYETSSTVPKVNNPSYENAKSPFSIHSQSSLNSSNLIRNIPKTDQSQGYSANSSISSNSESTQSNQTIFSNPPSTSIQLSGSYSSNPLSIPQTQASNPMPLIYSQQTYPYQNIPQQPLPISIPQAKAQNPIPYIYSQQPLSIPQAKAPNPIPYIYSQQPLSIPQAKAPNPIPLIFSQKPLSISIPQAKAPNPIPLIFSQKPLSIPQAKAPNPIPLIYNQETYNYQSCQPSQPLNSTNSYVYDQPLPANSQIPSSNPISNIYKISPQSPKISYIPSQSPHIVQPLSIQDPKLPPGSDLIKILTNTELQNFGKHRLPINSLHFFYTSYLKYHERVSRLALSFESLRRIRNDGNSYYRAIGAIYLEHLFTYSTSISELQHFLSRLDILITLLEPNQDSKDLISFRNSLLDLYSSKLSSGSSIILLQSYLNNSLFDRGMLLALRHLTYFFFQNLLSNSTGSWIDQGQFTLNRIRIMDKVAEEEEFELMADVIGAKIVHHSIYKENKVSSYNPKYNSYVSMTINLLQESGQFDILYSREDNARDRYDAEAMMFRVS